jgi:hypothetical protein
MSQAAAGKLLIPVVPEEQQHKYFRHVLNSCSHGPSRESLSATYDAVPSPDPHFVREFQTAHFDARIWELYLFAYFHASGFDVRRPAPQPDFLIGRGGLDVWVEAVTANPTQGESSAAIPPEPEGGEEYEQWIENVIAIKLAGPLTRKLDEKYWEYAHVGATPLVLAVADFHRERILRSPSGPLDTYLNGRKARVASPAGAEVELEHYDVTHHEVGRKRIPSGFFGLPGAEHISAVLFNNAGTLSKFNRMAYSRDRFPHIRMIRSGACHDEDPTATTPKAFAYEVGAHPETWAEGLSVFHNPNALFELPFGYFPGAAEHWTDAKGHHDALPSLYWSVTEVFGFPAGADISTLDQSIPIRIANLKAALNGILKGVKSS